MSLALYLHYPFCTNKCGYCDYYKESFHRESEREFFSALYVETELAVADKNLTDSVISSIFIGGGTPSLANAEYLAEWLSIVKRNFEVPDDIEFSVECNPESATLDRLQFFKELGVNRPLFGIQSFQTDLLKLLDRSHNPNDSQKAIYLANALGFRNFGVDLLYGLPGQTAKMLSRDLDQFIELEPPHISFYQLTVEENTHLAKQVESGEIRMPDQELSGALYQGGVEKMAEHGYERYEVCSFAQSGFECQHNQVYWKGGEYLGLGPSAHSYLGNNRFANIPNMQQYADSLRHGELPRIFDDSDDDARMTEAIMLGLRMADGVDRAYFKKRFGIEIADRLNRSEYNLLVESGHLIPDKGRLRLSDAGLSLADEITRRLIK